MAKAQSSLARFGMIPMAATAAGFVAAVALSIFLVQSMVSSGHQQQLGNAIAAELGQQVNINESSIKAQLDKLAAGTIAMEAIRGSNAEIIEAEAKLSVLVPGADRVRLIKKGTAKPDPGISTIQLYLSGSCEGSGRG